MSFNTIPYLLFLPLALLGYFAVPPRLKAWWLAGANCAFYAFCAAPGLALFLLAAALASYAGARAMQAAPRRKKVWLALALAADLGLLCFFKYNGFFPALVQGMAGLGLPASSGRLLMPLGISYYTFSTVSYLADVYRGRLAAERSFLYYFLYCSFFAYITAGPICRAGDILPQFKAPQSFEYARTIRALRLMLVGYFKQIAVADVLVRFVDAVYGDVYAYTGGVLTLAALGYGLYLYADFSGYSDLARGSALLLGLRLPENFCTPYVAATLGEFWNRWHISLSTWLKDYISIPLGGSRRGRARRCFNLLAVFLASGLWHGVGWGFIVWGLLHGLGRVAETILARGQKTPPPAGAARWVRWALTFVFVNVCWVFFRLPTLGEAAHLLTAQFAPGGFAAQCASAIAAGFDATPLLMAGYAAFCTVAVGLLALLDGWRHFGLEDGPLEDGIAALRPAARWALYYLLLALVFAAFIMQNGNYVGNVSFAYGGF